MTSKSKVGFLSLAEELHFYILSFLPYRDILRCTSVCKALRQTFTSSSELQYIVELGGQGLLPVLNTEFHKHVPISKRLQLLKDNASAWFKFNIRPVSIQDHPAFAPVYSQAGGWEIKRSFVDGHLCLFVEQDQLVKIFSLVPQSSPQIHREWSPESLRPVPDAHIDLVWIDPAQNLIAIAYSTDDDDYRNSLSWDRLFYIDLKTLDGDGVHPQAAGRTLFLSEFEEIQDRTLKLQGLGRHIAIQCGFDGVWWLQIWDWQHSTTSNSIIHYTSSYTSNVKSDEDFCFLGNDRFLTISNLNFYLFSIEDVSQKPTFLASFVVPVAVQACIEYVGPTDDIAHGPQPQIEAHQTLWTSDPEHRILFFTVYHAALAISTKVFFNLDPFKETLDKIPWEQWGPPNTRAFNPKFSVGASGNRVFQAVPVVGATADDGSAVTEYSSHMMDFSPLAVQRRQGQGQVVNEPSTIVVENESITTCLPYVEVLSDGKYSADAHDVVKIWVDRCEIYVPRLVSPSAMN